MSTAWMLIEIKSVSFFLFLSFTRQCNCVVIFEPTARCTCLQRNGYAISSKMTAIFENRSTLAQLYKCWCYRISANYIVCVYIGWHLRGVSACFSSLQVFWWWWWQRLRHLRFLLTSSDLCTPLQQFLFTSFYSSFLLPFSS